MNTCPGCGGKMRLQARYCPACGQAMGPGNGNCLAWEIQVPMLSNRFVLGQIRSFILTLMGLMFVIFAPIFALAGGIQTLWMVAALCLAVGLFFLLVSLLTLGLVFGNRAAFEYRITDDGITMVTLSRKARLIHRLAFIAGIMGGNPGAAGAGLSGMASESMTVAYPDIRRVLTYPAHAVVAVKPKWMARMHIYCPMELYNPVAAFISEKTGISKERN